jgi:hypothetical protein
MPTLSELQRGFAVATIFNDSTALAGLGVVDGGLDGAARIAIYRNNVLANYRKALAATYPVVQALVGPAFFGAAVENFVRAHPSTRGDVNRYGGELARFLTTYPPARGLPYLPDVARLEWAIDQASIAADASPLDLELLSGVPESALGELRFTLHPSAQFVVSRYPIFRIWQANQRGHENDPPVGLGEGGDTVLVVRGADGIGVHRLGAAAYQFLRALGRKDSLTQAVDRALRADPSFDAGGTLRMHVAAQTVVGFRLQTATSRGNEP